MQTFLLASHGSRGAMAAEEAVMSACVSDDEIHHLYVIPSWWADMTGDDWLNNGVSRNRFRSHLENELLKESNETINRIKEKCRQKKIYYKLHLHVGSSELTLRNIASKNQYEKIFLGERRPKHVDGVNDKMLTRKNINLLKNNLTIVPHPDG